MGVFLLRAGSGTQRVVRLPLALSCASLLACGPDPAVDRASCLTICDRYAACGDVRFDADACAAACDRDELDTSFRAAAADCVGCLDDGACADQADACADRCADVVDPS